MCRRTCSLVVLGVILLLLQAGTAAGVDVESRSLPLLPLDFRVSGDQATAGDYHPAVAWNATADEYLVVWEDGRNEATRGADIYARRVRADGKAIGPDRRISGNRATADDHTPVVAWNAVDNEYLVVWEDGRNEAARGTDIYGRRVSADGRPIGGDRRISGLKATADDYKPAVAWNAVDNEYLVIWGDGRNEATRGWDVYGRRVGTDGKPVGGDRRISGKNATENDHTPAVAWNAAADDYLAVWQDQRNWATGGWDVYGRRVGADGKPIGRDRRISGSKATVGEQDPAVAWNATADEYLVVWEDRRNEVTRGRDVYGRRVSADGKPVGGDRRISGKGATTDDDNPAVAWNAAANDYLVVWQDARNAATRKWDIYARAVGADGKPVGPDTLISGLNAFADEAYPAIACNQTAGQHLMVWTDWRNWPPRGSDIYGRRTDP